MTVYGRVLFIYTGGTLGMKNDQVKGYVPVKNYLTEKMASISQFHDAEFSLSHSDEGYMLALQSPSFADDELIDNGAMSNDGCEGNKCLTISQSSDSHSKVTRRLNALVTPVTKFGKRILYAILEYEPLLDSCNMTMSDWVKIATDIELNYHNFDAFIILHGTDTMAYTASALSFLLQDLGKSVIITGSQIPFSEMRNDALENVMGALTIAGHFIIPEVTVYFSNRLFRGNRTTKANANNFDAFESPNLKPLVRMGVEVSIAWDLVYRPKSLGKALSAHKYLNRNVAILRLFPSITESTIKSFLAPPMQGVVLLTFGAGNAPSRKDLLDALKEASDRGVVIVNVSQCRKGAVSDSYETGKQLLAAGVVAGADMTPECALCKLSYLLSLNHKPEQIRLLMCESMRGELTVPAGNIKSLVSPENKIVKAVIETLKMESKQVKDIIFPILITSTVASGSIAETKRVLEEASDFEYVNRTNDSGSAPLHIASAHGYLDIVEYLLGQGASVHLLDANQQTPLMVALKGNHTEVINLLVSTGSRLHLRSESCRNMYFKCAYEGDSSKLAFFLENGANINEATREGRTALHICCSLGHIDAVKVILAHKCHLNVSAKDIWGKTAFDDATALGFNAIANLIAEIGSKF